MRIFVLLLLLASYSSRAAMWITGYYPQQAAAVMTPSEIDFTLVTHVIHFAVIPNADGSLDTQDLAPADCQRLTAAAHSANRQALVCVGGADTEKGFVGATSQDHLEIFVQRLVKFVRANNYDGIDLDWEPLPRADFPQYINLVCHLHAALKAAASPSLLTAAVSAYPIYGDPPDSEYSMITSIQTNFDQINIMSYDLSGPYDGWISWYNSPVFDGGSRFKSTGRLLPSLDGAVRSFTDAGVQSGKLGIGIPFYGVVWAGGVSGPRQSWDAPPKVTQLSYADIMAQYFQTNAYHWDNAAQAAYLTIDPPATNHGFFISYDDETSCRAKLRYAREHHLGGLMIWHLGHDHQAAQPPGKRDPLLEALRGAGAN